MRKFDIVQKAEAGINTVIIDCLVKNEKEIEKEFNLFIQNVQKDEDNEVMSIELVVTDYERSFNDNFIIFLTDCVGSTHIYDIVEAVDTIAEVAEEVGFEEITLYVS